jgi:hypothetical protein
MTTTIQVKREYTDDAKSFDNLLAKLDDKYDGKWVAILESGDIVADEDLSQVHQMAEARATKITFEFRAHKKGQLFHR